MVFLSLVLDCPLSRAEHRRWGRKKRVGLSERSEFRHAPTASIGRCSKYRAVRQGARRSEARSNRQIVSTRASLATPHGGTIRRVIDRLDDAQDTRDTGGFFCFRFLM